MRSQKGKNKTNHSTALDGVSSKLQNKRGELKHT